jgi:hypothetical protein
MVQSSGAAVGRRSPLPFLVVAFHIYFFTVLIAGLLPGALFAILNHSLSLIIQVHALRIKSTSPLSTTATITAVQMTPP